MNDLLAPTSALLFVLTFVGLSALFGFNGYVALGLIYLLIAVLGFVYFWIGVRDDRR